MSLLITPCLFSLQLILLKRKLFPRRRVNMDSNPERVWQTKSSLSSPTSTPPLLPSVEDRKGSRPGGLGGIWRPSVLVLHQHRWRTETRVRWWWNIFQKMMDWAGRWREQQPERRGLWIFFFSTGGIQDLRHKHMNTQNTPFTLHHPSWVLCSSYHWLIRCLSTCQDSRCVCAGRKFHYKICCAQSWND